MKFVLYYFLLFSYFIWLLILTFPFFSIRILNGKKLKTISLLISIVQFCLVLIFWILKDNLDLRFSFIFYFKWIEFFNFHFIFGIDNISLIFLLLTFFLIPICILISWNNVKYKYNSFLMCLLFISFILFNFFCVYDLIFLYIFFEFILIPMFIMIGVWGSRQRKIHAVYQFFFFTLVGSLLMLLGIMLVYSNIQSTDVRILYHTSFTFHRQLVLWLSFFFAFCIKIPIYPFHIWLPEAHVEAPTVGSVILAGVLLKMGSYGLFRLVLPFFCDATYYFLPLVSVLCLIGIIYTSFATIRQIDLKKIIAYSSVSHMGFVVLGLFTTNLEGVIGSIFLMISHGIISSGLFFCIGCIYDRYKSRILRYYSGLVFTMPLFCVCFFILILSNISFPGTMGFVGEFLVLVGVLQNNYFVTFISVLSIILTAVYSIWLYNRMVFNEINISLINFSDLSRKEFLIASTFCFLSVLFGLKSSIIISFIEFPVVNYLNFFI